ncbi:Ribose methyltransferase [Podila minutissima]|nr:Ribose methyltransferase [Podila minutissima]
MILDWSTQPTIGRESFDSPLRDIGKPPPETLPRDSFSLRSRPKLRYGQSLPSSSRQSESARNKDSGFDDNRRILVDSIREKSHTPSIAPKEPVKMAVSPSWTPESGPLFFERSFSFGDSSHARVTNVQDRSSALSYLQGLSKGSAQEKHHPEREFLYSPNVVLPALKSGFRIPYKLYYSSEAGKGNSSRADDLAACLAVARRAGVDTIEADKAQLDQLSGIQDHEGVVLEATRMARKPVSMLGPITESGAYQVSLRGGSTRDYAHSVSNYGHRTKPLWIVLDGLESTHTLGSIIQTSHYMGVDGVVVCQHNSARLSASVSRASNGALERAPTYTLSNLTRFIQLSQENGWHVVGAATGSQGRYKQVGSTPGHNVDRATILVISHDTDKDHGSQILQLCDSIVHLPPSSSVVRTGTDSLDASVATAIVLSQLTGTAFRTTPNEAIYRQ